MSRLVPTLMVLFAVVINIGPANRVMAQDAASQIKTEYNSQKDITQITLNPIVLASRKLEQLQLGAVTGYPGKTKTQPREVALIFLSLSPLDTNKYESARKLSITADGEKVFAGPTQYSKQSQNGLFVESLTALIPFDAFLRLCRSKEASIKLGFTEVALSAKQIMLLQAFASYASE
jgi:hypothetical protein